ncbi:multicopper oxidase family protein [Leucobacter aridicollis]|uniref:multicopper oxidase family protein n=1 Tax=Leucobacter aridicollis TaxID=283878 RepID=UPI0021692F96|nr:multicopper oxidase domain-containing protein [Leucobacter aridicollis]MCS3427502.1 FtsP/CotA-like multicopper oxidase with cupredoxin domain [Leucobacter aridicollis]
MPGSSRITRRGVLAAAAAGAVTMSILALGGWRVARRPVISPESGSGSPLPPGATTARVPLAVPALDEGTVGDDGVRAFELVAQAGESSFVAGVRTPTWGYNGAFGGPTLRAAQGERVRVVVRNELAEVTTTHWHGMKLPAIADGGPHQPIAPGDSWTAEWTVEQPAATLWYHPHNHGTTEAHVYRGLAGLFIVDDAEPHVDAPLPREYGVDDIPVVVTDRSFSADGTFDERRRDAAGMLGDTLLVNGTVSPRFAATRELTRLRILNGSTARSYRFELDAGPLLLVGTDSGLLPKPVEVPGVTLTPGERAEVVVALAPGASAMLRSVPHTLGLLDSTERASGTGDTFEVLELTRDGATARPAAATLADLTGWIAAGGALAAPLTDPPEPDQRRTITLQDNKINHRRMNMARIDEVVTVGDRERWLITNEHFLPHNLHIHNARFRVHSIDGRAPTPELRGWKDTVYAPPSRTVVIDVEFGTSTDPHLPYMFHCHLLQHEDQGMMAQFVVVRPGEEAGPLDTPAIRDGGSHDGH